MATDAYPYRRTAGEWAHDTKDEVLEGFMETLREEGSLTEGGWWSLEIFWRVSVVHPYFGDLTEERYATCLRWVRNEATVVAIALAMKARGLGAVIQQAGTGSQTRRTFRPESWRKKTA